MMRPLFTAAAAVLFGVGVPPALAQCGCGRLAVSTPTASSQCATTPSLTPDDKPKRDDKPAAKADKEVTLTGTLVCAKCGLKEPGVKKCTNAIQVKEGDKTVTYYLDDKGSDEDYHEGLCGGGKKEGAKVIGTVTEKDGKKWVKATKVEEKK